MKTVRFTIAFDVSVPDDVHEDMLHLEWSSFPEPIVKNTHLKMGGYSFDEILVGTKLALVIGKG